jgi:hypothetical protein
VVDVVVGSSVVDVVDVVVGTTVVVVVVATASGLEIQEVGTMLLIYAGGKSGSVHSGVARMVRISECVY